MGIPRQHRLHHTVHLPLHHNRLQERRPLSRPFVFQILPERVPHRGHGEDFLYRILRLQEQQDGDAGAAHRLVLLEDLLHPRPHVLNARLDQSREIFLVT